ncbi:MAG: hypothetical protein ACWGQW_02605 [bacterium]
MASLWQARFTKEEKIKLERWWLEYNATRRVSGNWPPRWPKMEQRLKKREQKNG